MRWGKAEKRRKAKDSLTPSMGSGMKQTYRKCLLKQLGAKKEAGPTHWAAVRTYGK
jgi:hypothetical protein